MLNQTVLSGGGEGKKPIMDVLYIQTLNRKDATHRNKTEMEVWESSSLKQIELAQVRKQRTPCTGNGNTEDNFFSNSIHF